MKALVLSAAALASVAGAQQATRTVQQDFDAAEQLDQGTDKAAALAAWEALERRVTKNKRTTAIVRVRKSAALLAVDRKDEALAAAKAGLADLPTTDPTLTADRYQAWFNIGRIAQSAIDYAGAAEAYAKAEAIAETPTEKLGALLGEIATNTFVNPDAALAASTRADAILAANKVSPGLLANFADAKGVLLMNRGDLPNAIMETRRAVKLNGGLTSKTPLVEVPARSNAAIALLLAGRKDAAREYMAMTGAGRLTKGDFSPAAGMTPPDCGGEAGLKPDDVAVVEFSVGNNGEVILASPVYAAGGGAVALEFARAARNWSWTPDTVKEMPPFFRYFARVELRCNLAFERPSVRATLDDQLVAWLEQKGVTVPPEPSGSMAAAVSGQRSALAAAEAKGPTSLAVLPFMLRLMQNDLVGREETYALAVRGLAIARDNKAPPSALLALDWRNRTLSTADGERSRSASRVFDQMIADYSGDAQARSALRLMAADVAPKGRTREFLEQVTADRDLAKNDPMRVGALIRLASLDQEKGNVAAARALFEKSGLAANQCALLDGQPKMESVGGTFPEEAQRWGFEGWTRTQYDIGADGHVTHPRVIVSYPPFVFTDAGKATIAGARYSKTYRPDGGLGCAATTSNVRFRLPG